jgi:hypothetical protein
MKIRAALNAVLDPANSVYVTGDEESRKRHATSGTALASPPR